MKYIDADKLKYEIERRKLLNYYTDTDDYETELFEIIDSLQQEQPEVDVEEITKFSRIKDLPDGFDKDWLKYYHIDKEYDEVDVKASKEGFIAGWKCRNDQMLKDAVEGEVMTNGFYPYEPRIVASYPDCPYALGDKVRIVVLKAEEE